MTRTLWTSEETLLRAAATNRLDCTTSERLPRMFWELEGSLQTRLRSLIRTHKSGVSIFQLQMPNENARLFFTYKTQQGLVVDYPPEPFDSVLAPVIYTNAEKNSNWNWREKAFLPVMFACVAGFLGILFPNVGPWAALFVSIAMMVALVQCLKAYWYKRQVRVALQICKAEEDEIQEDPVLPLPFSLRGQEAEGD